jgi:hypothetical protein
MSYLYFAPNKEKTGFKIGFSNEPNKRLRRVKGKIDYERTYIFDCKNNKHVEDFCHKYFEDFNIALYESGDGKEEWYEICIFKVAIDLLLEHKELLGIKDHFLFKEKFSDKKEWSPNTELLMYDEELVNLSEAYEI